MAPCIVSALFCVGTIDAEANADSDLGGLSLARPKSNNFEPDLVSMMLPGFKFRWTTP